MFRTLFPRPEKRNSTSYSTLILQQHRQPSYVARRHASAARSIAEPILRHPQRNSLSQVAVTPRKDLEPSRGVYANIPRPLPGIHPSNGRLVWGCTKNRCTPTNFTIVWQQCQCESLHLYNTAGDINLFFLCCTLAAMTFLTDEHTSLECQKL